MTVAHLRAVTSAPREWLTTAAKAATAAVAERITRSPRRVAAAGPLDAGRGRISEPSRKQQG